MNRRQQSKAATRALLLRTARALFVERGVEPTTTREVARRAGVGVGTVFAHFPDKAALVEEVLADRIEQALDEALATLPTTDAIGGIVHVAACLYRAYGEHPAIARALVANALFRTGDSRLAAQRERFRAFVIERLRAERGAADDEDFFAFFGLYFAVLVAGLRGEIPAQAQPALLERLVRRALGGVG